jgi:hypothetical protein
MPNEMSPVDRDRHVFTACGTKQAVVQHAATNPNNVTADIAFPLTAFKRSPDTFRHVIAANY